MYRYANAVLMIFCKAPIAGQVKTRLHPVLTPQQCADVHTELSLRTIDMAVNSQLCPVQLWCSPSTDHPFFTDTATTYNLTLRQQHGNDLGERMHNAFCSALATCQHALLIGCDCPALNETDLIDALSALSEGNAAVLTPTEDGGYVLIGLNQPQPELFQGVNWGTPDVLSQTCHRIKQHHLPYVELNTRWDVDTATDLLRYYAYIAHS